MYALGFCLDEKYALPGAVVIASAADAIPPRERVEVAVRILGQNLRMVTVARLVRLAKRIGYGSCLVRWAAPARDVVMADRAYISTATYLRFLFTSEFVGRPYLIYLDADLFVQGEVAAPLSGLQPGRVAGVVDEFNSAVGRCPALPGLVEDRPDLVDRPYANAGVLWTHAETLAPMRRGVGTAMRAGARYILHNDQDALNLWLLDSGTLQLMPGGFNRFELGRFLERGDWVRRVVKRAPEATDAAVVHFVGANKPWQADCPPTPQVREYRTVWRRVMDAVGESPALRPAPAGGGA